MVIATCCRVGPDIHPNRGRREAHILDLPPTILALAGLPPGLGMSGTALDWALVDGLRPVDRDPVDYRKITTWRPPALDAPSARRTAISLRRSSPRASRKLARFTQAGGVSKKSPWKWKASAVSG